MRNPATIIEALAARWPKCISVYEARRKPLKVGIRDDILAALDGEITPRELGRALKFYVNNQVYKSRLVAGATRVALDGSPCGVVTPEQAAAAAGPVPVPAPTPPQPPARATLADLRAAARQRREMRSPGG